VGKRANMAYLLGHTFYLTSKPALAINMGEEEFFEGKEERLELLGPKWPEDRKAILLQNHV